MYIRDALYNRRALNGPILRDALYNRRALNGPILRDALYNRRALNGPIFEWLLTSFAINTPMSLMFDIIH